MFSFLYESSTRNTPEVLENYSARAQKKFFTQRSSSTTLSSTRATLPQKSIYCTGMLEAHGYRELSDSLFYRFNLPTFDIVRCNQSLQAQY